MNNNPPPSALFTEAMFEGNVDAAILSFTSEEKPGPVPGAKRGHSSSSPEFEVFRKTAAPRELREEKNEGASSEVPIDSWKDFESSISSPSCFYC